MYIAKLTESKRAGEKERKEARKNSQRVVKKKQQQQQLQILAYAYAPN